jgi:ParB family chromosome partitioning protein
MASELVLHASALPTIRDVRAYFAACVKTSNLDGALDATAKSRAVAAFTKRRGNRAAALHCEEIALWGDRACGEILAGQPRNRGGGTDERRSSVPTLRELLDVPTKDDALHAAKRLRAIAAVPEAEFRAYIAEARAEGAITVAGLLGTGGSNGAHVSHNSGDNEWYTPAEYIEAARTTLGDIDLDPASSDEANTIVRAEKFYTAKDDGLSKPWRGRVWLNPPYASELIVPFVDKLVQSYTSGHVPSAITLTNNATETEWFTSISKHAAALCLPRGRVRFWQPGKDSAAPLQGQAVLYLGKQPEVFAEHFGTFGRIWT